MDGKGRIRVIANLQIELEAYEIVEFEVGLTVLLTRLTNNSHLDPILYRGAGASIDRGVSTRGSKYQGVKKDA
jgi:hypothetical protein